MGSVDAYGPSSQTLTFLDPEETDLLAAGADTQVRFINTCNLCINFLMNYYSSNRPVNMSLLILLYRLKHKHRLKPSLMLVKVNLMLLKIIR